MRRILFQILLGGLVSMLAHAVWAESKVGVVVLHGKWGHPNNIVAEFARQLEAADFLVVRPEMPWSNKRMYDAGADAVMTDIDSAVNKLRVQGAHKICVAGHSMGAAGAVRYAGLYKVDCLIMLAPGHFPEGSYYRGLTGRDLARARELIAQGGDGRAEFEDYNTGNRTQSIAMAAQVYLDYFDPEGPFNMSKNAERILPGTPVLWVVGATESKGTRQAGDAVFARIPDSVPKKYMTVPGGHVETPKQAGDIAIEWLRQVVRRSGAMHE